MDSHRKAVVLLIVTLFTKVSAKETFLVPDGLKYRNMRNNVSKVLRLDFRRAESYLKKGRFKEADEYYIKVLMSGDNFYAHWGHALCQWKIGNSNGARSSFPSAYSICDTIPSFILNYSEFTLNEMKDWDLGSKIVSDYLLKSQSESALILIVNSGLELGYIDECKEILEGLTEKFPLSPVIWVYYSALLKEMNLVNESISAAIRAAHLSSNPYHLKMMVHILANNGKFLDAAKVCEKISKRAKNSSITYEAWGFLEYKQGHYESALANYRRALQCKYRVSTMLTLAKLNLYYLDNIVDARFYCKSALQIDRNNPAIYYLLSECSRRDGNIKSAIKYSNIHLKLTDNQPESYCYHGKLLYENGEYMKAIRFFERANELLPGSRKYRLILAQTYAKVGLVDEAKQTYENFTEESIENIWEEEEIKPSIVAQ